MPGAAILTILPPKYVFVAANVTWSLLTLITFKMNHVWQLVMLNVCGGGFSAIAYVGANFIYGSWYQKKELGKGAAVFVRFGHLGSMAGWIVIPGLPHHRVACFLTEEEKEHAVVRLESPKKETWDRTVFKLYSFAIQIESNKVFPLWMKSRRYSVIQQKNYDSPVNAFAIVGTVIYSVISDKIEPRWHCSIAISLTFILRSAILIASPRGDAGYFFAFYILGTTYAPQALWYSWMANVTSQDVQLRAITTGLMKSFDFAFVNRWPLLFYPVTNAPNYRKGYIASIVTGSLILLLVLVIAYLEKRGVANRTVGRNFVNEEDEASNSDTGVVEQNVPHKL
ncbi:hypothetical protein QTJ16_006076 [Diplocarpon rosae]|uniref:Uncharacterized protein n=1 Tax=Diplocarpon rosae TaxID=946125 RepID=A0AAD9SXE6_9HELO|nr:hypothetical protein QTJ16_006076 [Diplocarpon rosae]